MMVSKIRRIPVLMTIAVSFLALLGSCTQHARYSKREQALEMYSQSRSLIERYIDSISQCKDSLHLLGCADRFEARFTKVNFEFSPDTYLEMTEDENDTISKMLDRYVAIRDSLLYRFGHPLVLAPDNVASPDSISSSADASHTPSN